MIFLKLEREAGQCGFDAKNFQTYLDYLNQFYTSTRYPFLTGVLPNGIPAKKDAKQALDLLDEFLEFIKSSIK